MGRSRRLDIGGVVYHVLNRGNGRMTIFEDEGDYQAFERVLEQALERYPQMQLLAYCVMPNHWHTVLRPTTDGVLSKFVGWLTLTHTQRWHAHRHRVGGGHVYQGRFKSFLVDTEGYLATVCRYVERPRKNPVRANQVKRAEQWNWSSLYRWHASGSGSADAKRILSPWPTPGGKRPPNWLERVNMPETQDELDALRLASNRCQPFGGDAWQRRMMEQYGLESTFRPMGRPKKDVSDKKGS
jgi:putative transposase